MSLSTEIPNKLTTFLIQNNYCKEIQYYTENLIKALESKSKIDPWTKKISKYCVTLSRDKINADEKVLKLKQLLDALTKMFPEFNVKLEQVFSFVVRKNYFLNIEPQKNILKCKVFREI